MQKRKPPIFPIAFIIIALGFVIWSGLRQHPMPQAQTAPPPAAGDAPKADDPAAIKQKMRNSLTDSHMPMNMHPGGDPMLSNDAGPMKPKPSESSTDSQWYQPQANDKKAPSSN